MKPDAAFTTVLTTLSDAHPVPPPEGRVDWRAAIDCAVREGVFYPFYRRLAALDKAGRCLSAAEYDYANQLYAVCLARSAAFSAKAEVALVRLEAAKTPVILIKGPAVDRLIYDGYMRPRLDIDIVTASPGVAACRKALAHVGYVAGPDGSSIEDAIVFMHRTPGEIPIHLHRLLINNTFLTVDGHLRLNEEAVRDESEPLDGYRHIRCLKPELNLLYLCEHAVKHDVDELVFLYEIDRLARLYGPRFGWERFVTFAGETGLSRVAYHALTLAAGLFECPVPDDTLDALRPRRLSRGERSFLESVAARAQKRYASFAVYLAAREGIIEKARFVWRMFLRRAGRSAPRWD